MTQQRLRRDNLAFGLRALKIVLTAMAHFKAPHVMTLHCDTGVRVKSKLEFLLLTMKALFTH